MIRINNKDIEIRGDYEELINDFAGITCSLAEIFKKNKLNDPQKVLLAAFNYGVAVGLASKGTDEQKEEGDDV